MVVLRNDSCWWFVFHRPSCCSCQCLCYTPEGRFGHRVLEYSGWRDRNWLCHLTAGQTKLLQWDSALRAFITIEGVWHLISAINMPSDESLNVCMCVCFSVRTGWCSVSFVRWTLPVLLVYFGIWMKTQTILSRSNPSDSMERVWPAKSLTSGRLKSLNIFNPPWWIKVNMSVRSALIQCHSFYKAHFMFFCERRYWVTQPAHVSLICIC